jgi:hypothetical protein
MPTRNRTFTRRRETSGRLAGTRRQRSQSDSGRAREALELLSTIVPPVTLITALLFWFGFELVDARSAYFGLGPGTLGFSTTDYLIRGVEAGIVPLIALFLAVLAMVGLHNGAQHVGRRWGATRQFRWLLTATVVGGALISLAGAYAAFRPLPTPLNWYLLPPTLLAAGPLVTWFVARRLRPRRDSVTRSARITAMAVGGLVLVSLFWATSLYADALGRGRAVQLAASLEAQPRVTVYSEHALAIDPAIATTELLGPEESGRYRYRYDDLRLLIRSAEKYFLVPDDWTRAAGTVLVLLDSPDIRIEFAPGGQ